MRHPQPVVGKMTKNEQYLFTFSGLVCMRLYPIEWQEGSISDYKIERLKSRSDDRGPMGRLATSTLARRRCFAAQ